MRITSWCCMNVKESRNNCHSLKHLRCILATNLLQKQATAGTEDWWDVCSWCGATGKHYLPLYTVSQPDVRSPNHDLTQIQHTTLSVTHCTPTSRNHLSYCHAGDPNSPSLRQRSRTGTHWLAWSDIYLLLVDSRIEQNFHDLLPSVISPRHFIYRAVE